MSRFRLYICTVLNKMLVLSLTPECVLLLIYSIIILGLKEDMTKKTTLCQQLSLFTV